MRDNDTYEETIEAADRFAVYRDIHERGDTLVKLKEESPRKAFSLSFINEVLNNVTDDEKVVLKLGGLNSEARPPSLEEDSSQILDKNIFLR